MDAWQIPSEQFYFYIFVNCSYFISFLFFVCELFIINFFCCLICVDFFFLLSFIFVVCLFFLLYLPCFFVGFGGLGLPCHLLCCLLLFVYSFFLNLFLFYLFFFIFIFFTFMDFLGLFFVSLTALGTSSLRLIVFPWGGGTGAPFRGLVSRGSKLYKWWFGRASGLVDMELMKWYRGNGWRWVGKTIPGRGAVSGRSSPLAGHGWTIWEMVSIALFFFFLSFENPWWLMAERLVLFVAGGSEGPQVGKWIPQCFLEHYSCYDTDRTAEITDAPTS